MHQTKVYGGTCANFLAILNDSYSSFDPTGSHGRRSLPEPISGARLSPVGIPFFNDIQGSSSHGR
jgi:hypothetical protein